PFGRTERTFMLGEYLSFGSTLKARRAAQTINRLHRHVHGTLPIDAGAYATGSRYDARNPELLLWVHATLVDTLLLTYTLFFCPFIHISFHVTCALLPQPVREIYGLEWSGLRQRAFDASTLGMRTVIPRLPVSLRVLPVTLRIMEKTVSQSA